MPRVKRGRAIQTIVVEAINHLEPLSRVLPPSTAEDVHSVVAALSALTQLHRELSVNLLSAVTTAKNGRERILAYLKLFVGRPVRGDELAAVSAIGEYARRIRELRVEYGYSISTGNSRADLRPNEYVLESPEPDAHVAEQWRAANSIRKSKTLTSAQSRILALLKLRVGVPVSGDQLAYVAKIPTWARRARQLRTEEGWRVATRFSGRPELANSEYVLESVEQLPPHDRHIPDDVYGAVLDRDGLSCRRSGCGWHPSRRVAGDRRQFIELHHVEHHGSRGSNEVNNLVTLCNVCHDAAHRSDVVGASFWSWLGTPII